MLTLYRGNRAELLASLLANRLRLSPPGPFETVRVVVNTWPTSRWLGEQLALGLGDPLSPWANGVAANIRFPFPASQLRELVDLVLDDATTAIPGPRDPWRANELVWPLLEQLPSLIDQPEAALLGRWLEQRGGDSRRLDRALWRLARAIADAFDDYALYRPGMLALWQQQLRLDELGRPLPAEQHWQPLLFSRLLEKLDRPPFGLRVKAAIARLREASANGTHRALPDPIRLFGLSSLAPVQVELLQALSGHVNVELYLLTPCRELWRRRDQALETPLAEEWLLSVPRLEARFGRLGAEFQQLLEGTGVSQLGQWQDRDLFFGAATAAENSSRSPTLLEQLQEQLVDPGQRPGLSLAEGDHSLEFLACPGRLRQVQIVRDRVLQLMAADPTLAPRDVLVMSPQVETFAPLVAAVFGDLDATGVNLPWRLTDRSQQSDPGLAQGLLALLEMAGERLTASALEGLLACGPLLNRHGVDPTDAGGITTLLQSAGFRWGLDGRARGGDPCHSLGWAIDRLLLGLALPVQPGLAPCETAPLRMEGSLDRQIRWIELLLGLRRTLEQLEVPRTPKRWIELLRRLLDELFGDGGDRAWELPAILSALCDWGTVAADSDLELPAAVVAEVLGERLAADSGRFGHRSGALTIGGLEPMRAIPHRLIVLMGLEAGAFPRRRERPGFHLMEQQRQLGDPNPADQDRYVLLESLLSARQHLLITWSSRDSRSGEALMPSTPVRQWLALLEEQLPPEAMGRLLREPAANPLERRNFLPDGAAPPISSDQRLLRARRLLESAGNLPPLALAATAAPVESAPSAVDGPTIHDDLLRWLRAPQEHWLVGLGLHPKERSQQVLDLDPLTLDERERAGLLREALRLPRVPPAEAPDWQAEQRGRGRLPGGAAGQLEARLLRERFLSLTAVLSDLGEERLVPAATTGLEAALPWRGDQLVLVHTALPGTAQRLELWLTLLMACAAGQQPRGGLLVARDQDSFRVVESFTPPAAKQAASHLEQLRLLQEQHRGRCWPVPPRSGWAWAETERRRPGQGRQAAAVAWEGQPGRAGERTQEVMALCFGASLSGEDLVNERFTAAAGELLQPLLEHHSVEKKGGRRR